ncbi:MAG: dihydrofolate reductase [Chitinophagaceae bacterium]|nr:MAG: dihydrofolate reductase [Chitinophagaceae bacterium]
MRNIISFMHISLDGFVAAANGALNWVTVNEEIFSYVGRRISRSDTAMYGRVTYEMMESYWPTAGEKPNASQHDKDHSRWYAGARKIVLSRTLTSDNASNTAIISDDLGANIRQLKQQPGEDILVFGSPTATHSLMQQDLIDGFWLFLNPVLLGEGVPLFRDIRERKMLKLGNTHQFDCGVMELNYTMER